MNEKLNEQTSKKKLVVLNILLVVAACCLVIMACQVVEEILWELTYSDVSESSILYALEDEEYGRMVEMYYSNCGVDGEEDKALQEYYGVAKYYEAAFFYKLYLEDGDEEAAKAQKEAMDAAAMQMGDFSFVKEKIDTKLGLLY